MSDPRSEQRVERMIGELRQRRLSYTDIANESGVSRATAWRLGNGVAGGISYTTFSKVEKLHRERCNPPKS